MEPYVNPSCCCYQDVRQLFPFTMEPPVMNLSCFKDTYIVNSCPRGYVLIINIEIFDNDVKQRRLGSNRDLEELKQLWEDFGYVVKEYRNLNLKAFQFAVAEFASMKELAAVDSALVFVMSHGKEDEANLQGLKITTADNQYLSADWIREQFASANCKSLINKPKVIFFQACRGMKRDAGIPCDDFVSCARPDTVPAVTDLLMVYPTLPGYVSQRDTKMGAWFIQELIRVLRNNPTNMDLVSILNQVDQNVRIRCQVQRGCYFQVLYYESWGFNRRLHFTPFKKDNRDHLTFFPINCFQNKLTF